MTYHLAQINIVEARFPLDDPRMKDFLVNMTVWESVAALKDFIYKGDHLKAFMRRKEWFVSMKKSHLALWWIPEGHIPTLAEAEQKLEQLWLEGPSDDVFTFRKLFPSPT